MHYLLLLLLAVVVWAGDADSSKLPADAQAAVDKADKAISAIQAKADAEIGKIRQGLIVTLTKAQAAVTKKGDLDGANAVKGKIDALEKLMPDLLTETKIQVDPSKFKSYGVKAWDNLPVEAKLIATTEAGPYTLEEGEEAVIIPHPTETWSAGKGYPLVPYTGSGQVYGNMPWMVMVWVMRKPDGQNTTGVVDPTKSLPGPCTFSVRPNDGILDDNIGGIRVKVITQKRK